MKKITFTIALLAMICISFTAKAGLIAGKNPVITTDLALTDSLPGLASKNITITFDFTNSGTTLTGTETLVIYFWAPFSHTSGTSVGINNVAGTLKWTLSMTPSTFFGRNAGSFLESGKNACWFNIQQSGVSGDLTGTLNLTFPVTKKLPYLSNTTFAGNTPNITGIPGGQYSFDQPITWSFDLDGTIFDKTQELYIWAWDPTNPETINGRTGTYNSPSSDNVTKLTWVSGMRWKITVTPTTFYGKTVAELQANSRSSFWMLIRNKNGLVKTQSFAVPTTIALTTGTDSPISSCFTAYPNPVVDKLTIALKDNNFTSVTVYDFKGAVLQRVPVIAHQQDLSVNFTNYAKGVYFVVLSGNGKTESFKVTK